MDDFPDPSVTIGPDKNLPLLLASLEKITFSKGSSITVLVEVVVKSKPEQLGCTSVKRLVSTSCDPNGNRSAKELKRHPAPAVSISNDAPAGRVGT